jgi:hypothetical protein
LYPKRVGVGRGHKDPALEKLNLGSNFRRATLSEAREINEYPDLSDLVRDGKLKFDHVLKLARVAEPRMRLRRERTLLRENADH